MPIATVSTGTSGYLLVEAADQPHVVVSEDEGMLFWGAAPSATPSAATLRADRQPRSVT